MAYNNNRNYNNRKNDNDITGFVYPKEDKNGDEYLQTHLDLGNGKALKILFFDAPDKCEKSRYIAKAYKVSYGGKSTKRETWK